MHESPAHVALSSRSVHVTHRLVRSAFTLRLTGRLHDAIVAAIVGATGSTLTAVGRSRLLARWPGTYSQILSGIQRAAQTVLGICFKCTCSRVTSASSALEVLNDYALYKSTHSLTHRSHDCLHETIGRHDYRSNYRRNRLRILRIQYLDV